MTYTRQFLYSYVLCHACSTNNEQIDKINDGVPYEFNALQYYEANIIDSNIFLCSGHVLGIHECHYVAASVQCAECGVQCAVVVAAPWCGRQGRVV